MSNKEKGKIIKKLVVLYHSQCKAIDECPFIQKKVNIFWRLAGGKISQADVMKEKLYLRVITAIEQVVSL